MLLILWATPRSTSTAFEWMMRQRGDFDCYHEPWNELYYYGQDRVSQRDAHVEARPGHTFDATWEQLITTSQQRPVFVKDFAYSVEHTLTNERLDACTHTFLIRDPVRVIQGMAKHWPDCSWEEVGFASLHRLFHRIADRTGSPPPVMTSASLLAEPETTAAAYCTASGIPFIEEALVWESGERSEVSWYGEGSGPWHDTLRESTGIKPPATKYPPLEENPRLFEMAERAQPLYDELASYAMQPENKTHSATDAQSTIETEHETEQRTNQ